MTELALDPIQMLRPRRRITGASAIMLPFTKDGPIDWLAFTAHVVRTANAGLIPAVNMDTGYVNLLDDATRIQVLDQTAAVLAGQLFFAGAYVGDRPDSEFDRNAYLRQIELIVNRGGIPVIFQSYGLVSQPDDAIVAAYAELGRHCDRFVGFELGTMFAPFGKIYSLDGFRELLGIPQCIGVKHSSLRRDLEWRRITLRDQLRPDFQVYTGNDLAIDMVMYGSDYLLGLSTFAPDLFAQRDSLWANGDSGFYELNDVLQYLGFLAFRPPVPAYKHSAAMFLNLRGWIASDLTFADCPQRPPSDRVLLRAIGARLNIPMSD